MSRNTIIVLICHRHKLSDLICSDPSLLKLKLILKAELLARTNSHAQSFRLDFKLEYRMLEVNTRCCVVQVLMLASVHSKTNAVYTRHRIYRVSIKFFPDFTNSLHKNCDRYKDTVFLQSLPQLKKSFVLH
jgi:hypothetical protein